MQTKTENNMIHDEKKKSISYETFLKYAQEHIAKKYAAVLADEDKYEDLKAYIEHFYIQNNYNIEVMDNTDELYERMFNDMAGYSVLTNYLNGSRNDLEEINLNSWEDIALHNDKGNIIKDKEKFFNPTHALDIIKRMLHKSGMVLDMSKPIVRGFLNKNVRLTVVAPPVIDSDAGVAASIRIINPKKLSKQDFIKKETATEEMLDFLCLALRYNISACITGSTGSGKTTLMSWILSTIPDNKRIITIEEGVREFDLVKRDEKGKVINNILHMVTKQSDNEKECITSEMLVSTSLTLNPDVLVVAEMKDKEAFAAQEAARTGHAVITTIHADSAEDTYDRMSSLCMLKHNMDYNIVNTLVKKAFPIVAFAKKLEDNSRHIMSIIECYFNEKGESVINVLYRYIVDENIYDENGKCHIKGHYEKVNNISDKLLNKFFENGMPKNIIEKFLDERCCYA